MLTQSFQSNLPNPNKEFSGFLHRTCNFNRYEDFENATLYTIDSQTNIDGVYFIDGELSLITYKIF